MGICEKEIWCIRISKHHFNYLFQSFGGHGCSAWIMRWRKHFFSSFCFSPYRYLKFSLREMVIFSPSKSLFPSIQNILLISVPLKCLFQGIVRNGSLGLAMGEAPAMASSLSKQKNNSLLSSTSCLQSSSVIASNLNRTGLSLSPFLPVWVCFKMYY